MKDIIIQISIFLLSCAFILFLFWWVMKSIDKMEKKVENLQIWIETPAGYITSGCVLLIFGVALLAVGIHKSKEYAYFKKNGISVQGVISDIESISDGEDTSHEVYVTFTAKGKEYTFKSHYYSSNMKRGDSVPVLYMPDNPEKAMVANGRSGVLIIIVFGLILVLCGAGLLRTYKMYLPEEKAVTEQKR